MYEGIVRLLEPSWRYTAVNTDFLHVLPLFLSILCPYSYDYLTIFNICIPVNIQKELQLTVEPFKILFLFFHKVLSSFQALINYIIIVAM